ncbi:ferredoxin [Oceanidesulfovibrio indonesiensis]|uniref:Ferredoxin n=1 Tax=Oceanidesulfovibrio indonesiensis TaxID=54767 RepID=A0A7M3MFP8_9BACT|nr:ferredoxin [Oceanidesulfovibrio indonesiensis]TVM17343.1 ferredoxin [Oceanidesulfovibrio indonesiensis]
MSKKRVSFSPGGCKMCEACVSLAPECFEIDQDTGMLMQKIEYVDEDLARELCAYCPEDCIEMEDVVEE